MKSEAQRRAKSRAAEVERSVETILLPNPKALLTKIRGFLLRQREDGHPGNGVEAMRLEDSKGEFLIATGPHIDKGRVDGHFILRSGARLSLGVVVRADGTRSRLVASWFDYRHERLPVLRYELARKEVDPLREPRAHLHLGLDDLRLPSCVLDPFEILDLLFFVVDPALSSPV